MMKLGMGISNYRRKIQGIITPVVSVLQDHFPVISRASFGTNVAILPLLQATTAGSTLILHARVYGSGYTVTDNLGGSTIGGQWIVASSGSADGPPVFTWVYRGCPAGITSITVMRGDSTYIIDQRLYFQEVTNLSLVSPIVTYNQTTGITNQTGVSFSVPPSGFFAVHIHLSPSRNPSPLNIGSIVRRLNFQDTAGLLPYADAVSEHCIYGISTAGSSTFGSNWASDLSTIWWNGIFIPS